VKQLDLRLTGLHKDFLRLATQYRQIFSSETVAVEAPNLDTGKSSDDDQQNQKKKKVLRTITTQIHMLLSDIHQADGPVVWQHIEDTEDLFRGVCRILQDMTKVSAQLCEHAENNDIQEYIDVAERCLRDLIMLGSDRSLLVESSKNWEANATTSYPKPSSLIKSPISGSAMKTWVSSLLGGFPSRDQPTSTMHHPSTNRQLTHQDPALGITPELFRGVMHSIQSSARRSAEHTDDDSRKSDYGRDPYQKASQRMIQLLDATPSDFVPSVEAAQIILDTLSRVGTVESARESYNIFGKHPDNKHRLRFSLVLDAYLEAVKQESDPEAKNNLVKEVDQVLREQWNVYYPKHEVERIAHCAIVLNCLVLGGSLDSQAVQQQIDDLVELTLGSKEYAKLQAFVESNEGIPDAQMLPVLNFMTQVRASTAAKKDLEICKRLLNFMLENHSDTVNRFYLYPNVHTFDAVLRGLATYYQALPKKIADNDAREADLKYATDLLTHMFRQEEERCWPSVDSFDSAFTLLRAINPEGVGERGEAILDMLEIRSTFSVSKDVRAALKHYHSAISCWWQATQASSNPRGACERALALLRRMEMQSKPLLLSDREFRLISMPKLYNRELRPTRNTYSLILRICSDTSHPSEYQLAVEVAMEVYRRMIRDNVVPDTADLAMKCCAKLPEDSEKRTKMEALVRSTLSPSEIEYLDQVAAT
jgi:hypothetical protein